MKNESYMNINDIEIKTENAYKQRTIYRLNTRLWMAGVLFLADIFSLFAAIWVAVRIRQSIGVFYEAADYEKIYLLLASIIVVSFYRKGLYPTVGVNYVVELQNIVSCICFSFFIMISITFLLKTTASYSRLLLLFAWMLSLLFVPASRYLLCKLLFRLRLWGEPVAIIGNPKTILQLGEYLRINIQFGFRPKALFHDEFFSSDDIDADPPLPVYRIMEAAKRMSLNTVLVIIDDLNNIETLIERYRFVFKRVILIKKQDNLYGLNNLKTIDLLDVMGFEVKNNLLGFWSQFIKRGIDIAVSSLGLLLLSPFLGLIGLLIKLDSRGEVFYRQPRLGKKGDVFNLLKFRSMYQDSDHLLELELLSDSLLKKEWDHFQKLKNDPRITRIGRFLRKFSLDELPQLWNVFIGEMSIVGPRPIMVNQRDMYGKSFEEYIHVIPGITGLWQVSGRNQNSFRRRVELDNEYIQRWSIWLDIYIILKTFKVVFWQQGAF